MSFVSSMTADNSEALNKNSLNLSISSFFSFKPSSLKNKEKLRVRSSYSLWIWQIDPLLSLLAKLWIFLIVVKSSFISYLIVSSSMYLEHRPSKAPKIEVLFKVITGLSTCYLKFPFFWGGILAIPSSLLFIILDFPSFFYASIFFDKVVIFLVDY